MSGAVRVHWSLYLWGDTPLYRQPWFCSPQFANRFTANRPTANRSSLEVLMPTESPVAQRTQSSASKPKTEFNTRVTGLTCFACGQHHDHRQAQTVCRACGMPLRVDYALDKSTMARTAPAAGPS